MVSLLRDDREPRLDLPCRRPILLGSSSSSTSPVSCATAMQRFGSDGSKRGHCGCALETAHNPIRDIRRIACGFNAADSSRQAGTLLPRGGAPRSNLNSVWLHGPLKAACSSFCPFVASCRSNISRMRAFCGDKSFPITAPAACRVFPPPSNP